MTDTLVATPDPDPRPAARSEAARQLDNQDLPPRTVLTYDFSLGEWIPVGYGRINWKR